MLSNLSTLLSSYRLLVITEAFTSSEASFKRYGMKKLINLTQKQCEPFIICLKINFDYHLKGSWSALKVLQLLYVNQAYVNLNYVNHGSKITPAPDKN